MKTIADVSHETLVIEAILRELKPGDFISYEELESLSGVPMNIKGKSYMRTAARRLKIEFTTKRGVGIVTASPKNSCSIIAESVTRIDNSVFRAQKRNKNIINQFYDEMNDKDQKVVNKAAQELGTMRCFSRETKLIFKKEELKQSRNGN
jgi:hypothetical protein